MGVGHICVTVEWQFLTLYTFNVSSLKTVTLEVTLGRIYLGIPMPYTNSKLAFRLGEFTPSYILHTRAFGTYLLGGLFTLQKKL